MAVDDILGRGGLCILLLLVVVVCVNLIAFATGRNNLWTDFVSLKMVNTSAVHETPALKASTAAHRNDTWMVVGAPGASTVADKKSAPTVAEAISTTLRATTRESSHTAVVDPSIYLGKHTVDMKCAWPNNLHPQHGDMKNYILARLQSPLPFSFVRFGDGEWMCFLLQSFQNVDKQNAHRDMCTTLREMMTHPRSRNDKVYLFVDHRHICGFVRQIERVPGTLPLGFVSFGFISHLYDGISDMMAAIRRRGPVVLVGPAFLGRLHKVFGHRAHILVPNRKVCGGIKDAWSDHQRIEDEMLASSRLAGDGTPVTFLVAGGMAMKVIVMKVAFLVGNKDSFLDIGSVFDGFAGHASRDYNDPHRNPRYKEVGIREGWFNETDVDHVGC